MFRFVCASLTIILLAACGTASTRAENPRVVLSEHKGWKIRVTPSFSEAAERWRARVEVWPPDRNHETHHGIIVRFGEEASAQGAVVQAGLASARRYIDASHTQPQ